MRDSPNPFKRDKLITLYIKQYIISENESLDYRQPEMLYR